MPTNTGGDDPRFMWYPDKVEFGYPQGTRGRDGERIRYFILHITQGTDSLDYLATQERGSSTHYLTWKDGTPRAQVLADGDAAWTAGYRLFNLRGINGEVERLINGGVWDDAVLRNVAQSFAPIAARHGVDPVYLGRNAGDRSGWLGHRDVPDGSGGWGGSTHHEDPGADFPWEPFMRYVVAIGTAPAPTLQDRLKMPDLNPDARLTRTGERKYLPFIFTDYYDRWGGINVFGLWRTGVFIEDGKLVAYTEGYRFEYQPAVAGMVERGLLGDEVLAARYPSGPPA